MVGVVCLNPVTGCVEPWTIAGPTDGSTNIVHHDENRDYQLATANDSQYGASYLGITECCKPLYNPSTGNLTVDCATTTSTGVDVNADDTVDVAHPIIAQNYDCDDAEFKNKLIKTSCFNYNPQCYVCNDPVTGNPVRKPVVHIGTLCADELLGYNDGLPRRIDVCEDCWRCIPFIGEDNGEETLDTSSACDTFSHNSCTCTTKMEHLEIADICKPGDIYIGNRTFNPNAFEFSTKDPTNTFDTKFAGFKAQMSGSGFHVCEVNPSTCCANYRLSLSDSCSSIETNSLTIKPTGNASLCLSLNYIPLTSNTENSNYELVGLNVSNNQLKKLDGFSYNPTTCYLCGNFCGNINIWPYECCSAYSANRMEADANCFKVSVCNVTNSLTSSYCFGDSVYFNAATTNYDSVLEMRYGITRLATALPSNHNCRCSELFLNECKSCLHAVCNTYIGGDCCVVINSYENVSINAKCNTSFYGTSVFCSCRVQCGGPQCSQIFNDYNELKFTTCCNDAVVAIHDIYVGNAYGCPNRLAVCCDANVGWQNYALMCDVQSAGDTTYVSGDTTYVSFAELLSCIASCKTIVPGVFNFSSDISFSDSRGRSYLANEFVGTFFKETPTRGYFNGMFCYPSRGLYSINFWYSVGAMSSPWTVVTPIPGTMYGTASVNGINVEGTV